MSETLPNSAPRRILVVDDHQPTATMLQLTIQELVPSCFEVMKANSKTECLTLMHKFQFDLVFIDFYLGPDSGQSVIEQAQQEGLNSKFVYISGVSNVRETLDSLGKTSSDFLLKPISAPMLQGVLQRRFPEIVSWGDQTMTWRERFAPEIIGDHPSILQVLLVIERVAMSDATVLIIGEAGTGKELVARAVHRASKRSKGKYIPINVTATSDTLFESSLFGWIKGAFTGATSNRAGFFEEADQGTIFMDEIGDLPLHQQPKLLRVLQDGTFFRVGEQHQPRTSNARIVAATNHDLAVMVKENKFRNDLYWRFNEIPIYVPALRERASDIPKLAEYFLARAAKSSGNPPLVLKSSANAWLQEQHWPGNIRELEHSLRRVSLLHTGGQQVDADDLRRYLATSFGERGCCGRPPDLTPKLQSEPIISPPDTQGGAEPDQPPMKQVLTGKERDARASNHAVTQRTMLGLINLPEERLVLKEFQEQIEVKLIWQALRDHGFVRKRAAERLGTQRTTLVEKIKKLARTYPRLAQESPRPDDKKVGLDELRDPPPALEPETDQSAKPQS